MPSVDEKKIREEARRLREKGKSLSGFWVSELSAAIYALEWVLGKRERAPSEDIGERESGHGKLAESISKAAEKEPPAAVKPPKVVEKAPPPVKSRKPPTKRR